MEDNPNDLTSVGNGIGPGKVVSFSSSDKILHFNENNLPEENPIEHVASKSAKIKKVDPLVDQLESLAEELETHDNEVIIYNLQVQMGDIADKIDLACQGLDLKTANIISKVIYDLFS